MTDFQPVSIERGRELLKQNAPYVFQQVTLKYPLQTEQIKIETPKPIQATQKSVPSNGLSEETLKGAADFQKYLDDDWAKRNPETKTL